jgi:hypothetical protein
MRNAHHMVTVIALLGGVAVITQPAHARWYGSPRPPIYTGPGMPGYTIPPDFVYIGPSIFTGAPVYASPYGALPAYGLYRYAYPYPYRARRVRPYSDR